MNDKQQFCAVRLMSLVFCAAAWLCPQAGAADKYLPAFPGAEGFGAFTPGGRGGMVFAVTTLQDYDVSQGEAIIPGSLRQAIESQGPRIVVFRLSGTIFLKRTLSISEPYLTLAGQTAPGDGVCIARRQFSVGAHDVIIRHMRFRLGDEAHAEIGTFQVSGAQNVILDHCSFSWSMDENCTLHGGAARNLTVQWCVISESLNRSFHPKGEHGHGSLLRSDDGGFSIHHSIYAHNNARNPRPGGYEDKPGLLLDFRNNVVYDWGNTSGYSGLERTRLNYVANYFKAGPSTSRAVREFAFSAKTFRTKIFLADNYFYGLPEKNAQNWLMIRKWGEWEGEIKDTNLVPEPFPAPPITTDPAEAAFEKVLANAGATLPRRDAVDSRVLQEIRAGKGRIIDSQNEVGGWLELKSAPAPADTDGDGMPDDWEKRFGFNAANAADGGQDADGDGYTNVEEYLNANDPKVSDRKPLGFDFDSILAKIEVLNAKSRAEIAEEKRDRPKDAGMDGSAPPPLRKMELRPSTIASAPKSVTVILGQVPGLQLNWIPGGTFVMGTPADEPERKSDEQQHTVTISRPFYMGATLVTAAEYQVVTGGSPARGREGELPAEVTWSDAVRFCNPLTRNTGRKFRLPTEAEWEYACRAGTTTSFNTGGIITTDQANFDGKFVYPGGQRGEYRRGPTPVRTFKPNAWGLFDTHGNAYQWCLDWFGPYPPGVVTDPQGPDTGNTRVIRGGRYGSGPRYIRSGARYSYNPNNSSVVFGFRVVMEADSQGAALKIGTTSFGFRYAFLDPAKSPTMAQMIRQAGDAGVERLQICENTRPLEFSRRDWQEATRCAADLGVEIQIGCKTLKPEVVERFLRLAQELSCNQLRIVTEEPDEHLRGNRENVTRLLEAIVPKLQRVGLRLAIENHFDISSTLLTELASPYPVEVVGFCVDTANSLRSFEPSLDVVRLLRERAYCYHLKDYRVVGSMISFSVVGVPLGEGDLDLDGCLRLIFAKKPVPPLFVETWTPFENHRERDIALDADWLRRSVANLRGRLAALD